MCGLFFFFKQKTAYEMRISDWSSDVLFRSKAAVVGEQRQPFCGALDKLGHLPVRGERAEARAVGEVRVVAAEEVVAELAGDDPTRVRAVGNCAAGAVALSAVALSAVVLGAIVLGSDRKSTRLNSSH